MPPPNHERAWARVRRVITGGAGRAPKRSRQSGQPGRPLNLRDAPRRDLVHGGAVCGNWEVGQPPFSVPDRYVLGESPGTVHLALTQGVDGWGATESHGLHGAACRDTL